MLLLGKVKTEVSWPAAELKITLTPLHEDKDRLFRKECTTQVFKEGKLVDIEFDDTKYHELVGAECIHAWSGNGVGDENGNPAECTPSNIARFMNVGEARKFIMSKVKSLDICLKKELVEAKND